VYVQLEFTAVIASNRQIVSTNTSASADMSIEAIDDPAKRKPMNKQILEPNVRYNGADFGL
jgi:hypothetical protein